MTLSESATEELWETFRARGGAELVHDAARLVSGADRGRGRQGDRRGPL